MRRININQSSKNNFASSFEKLACFNCTEENDIMQSKMWLSNMFTDQEWFRRCMWLLIEEGQAVKILKYVIFMRPDFILLSTLS